MRRFTYEAINAEGQVLNGELRAHDERAACRQLEHKGLRVLSVASAQLRVRQHKRRMQSSDLILAFHELATMLHSGVTIADAVNAQSLSAHHPTLVSAFEQMGAGLRRGQAFSDTLGLSGLSIPDYLVQLVRAGELTGKLGGALADAVAQMEYEHKLRTEIRNALIYPSILVLAGIGAVLLMFTFVVPKFASLLNKAEQLPWLAYAVLAGGTWSNEHGLWLLGAVALMGIVAFKAFRHEPWRLAVFDRMSHWPLLGEWLVEADTARWAKVLGAMLGNRVSLMRALELAQQGVRLPQRRLRLGEVSKAVRGGRSLADALEDEDALTATGYNLIRIGEKSGELPAMLASLARLYDESGRTRMQRLLIVIEPLAILLIGSVVGTIILGVVLAITSANDLAI
ncbi:MAG: type II secretion system F family protein [Gammaproteobacteria bacterium]|nr:type II secretion system F family protein [Gammaproteobacteria bacterium]